MTSLPTMVFAADIPDGVHKSEDPVRGLKLESVYVDGRKNGLEKAFNSKGELVRDSYFKNGKNMGLSYLKRKKIKAILSGSKK